MASKRPSWKTKRPKERWLLTRKTWRYMADAGRRLIPEGVTDTAEDLPVIERNFQDVCRRETRFLLWRKCSYPSALKHPRPSRKHLKGLKSRAGSATELEIAPEYVKLTREDKGRNSLPGVPKGWSPLAHQRIRKGIWHRSSGTSSHFDSAAADKRVVFETEDEDQDARTETGYEGERSEALQQTSQKPSVNLRTENKEHFGVRKKLSNFWKGATSIGDGSSRNTVSRGNSGSVRSKTRKQVSELPDNALKTDVVRQYHLKGASTAHSEDDRFTTDSQHARLRKVSPGDNPEITSPQIRFASRTSRRVEPGRETVTLRHVVESGAYDRQHVSSAPTDQTFALRFPKYDNRDYFEDENDVGWSSASCRSPSYRDLTHAELASQNTSRLRTCGRGSHSNFHNLSKNSSNTINERVTSRHNLTLPGLNIARPAKPGDDGNATSSSSSPLNFATTNLQPIDSEAGFPLTRTRRSGKVEHDFILRQSNLNHWKNEDHAVANDNAVDGASNNKGVSLGGSTCQQNAKPPVGKTLQQQPCNTNSPALRKTSSSSKFCDQGTQTLVISGTIMRLIEAEVIRNYDNSTLSPSPVTSPPPVTKSLSSTKSSLDTRKSSVDSTRSGAASMTEDCSPSVGDKLLRYLRMARKKSNDADKVDRFKTVNYDRTLRYIKSKGPIEDDNIKYIQTDESWLKLAPDPELFAYDETIPDSVVDLGHDDTHLFSSSDQESSDLGFASSSRVASSRSSFDAGELTITVPTYPQSPTQSPSSGHSFLTQLLHGLQQAAGNPHMSLPTAMQKSKSSSSVGHHGSRLMSKKIWRARSKSQSRATPSTTSTWTPQGQCRWTSVTGRGVLLQPTSLLYLTEIERRVLQQVALAKLQALNLGVSIRIPSDETVTAAPKPKRRAYLLKRRALTTGFFDSGRKESSSDKEKVSGSGLVFGIPLSQCIANDRISDEARGSVGSAGGEGGVSPLELRRRSHHGSRTSFSSLGDSARAEQSGSCESLPEGRPGIAGSVPGHLDVLSSLGGEDAEVPSPSVPHLVSTCCRHIMQHGLHTLGIFRVSSSKKRVRQLREDFDCGRDIEMTEELCPHDAATLLKEFFRDLPEPLMCRELYPAFVQTQRIRNRRLQFEAIQHLVQLLPEANRDTLGTLLSFLHTVGAHSSDRRDETGEWLVGNKMDSTNLATLFAPNILHCFRPGASAKEAAAERHEDRTDAINVTRSLIDHHAEVFEVSAELLDEVYLHMMDSHPDSLDHLLSKLCYGGDEMVDDGDNNSVFEGSEGSSVPRTPTEGAATPLSAPSEDKSDRSWTDSSRKVWSREEFLHETAGMGGPDVGMLRRHRGRERSKKRGKEESAESSAGGPPSSRWFSQSGSKKLEKSSIGEDSRRRSERGSSSSGGCGTGVTSEPATPLSSPPVPSFSSSRSPSIDDSQASTIVAAGSRCEESVARTRENSGGGNVITASLKIPAPGVATSSSFVLSLDDIPYIEDDRGSTTSGRRSVDSVPSSIHTARPSTDSAIGSAMSPAPGSEAPFTTSGLSSPRSGLASPTSEDVPGGMMATTGRILIPALSSTTATKVTTTMRRGIEVTPSKPITVSAEAVLLERIPSVKEEKKKYARRRYTDSRHTTTQFPDVESLEGATTGAVSNVEQMAKAGITTSKSQVWKRKELIASDPKDHETFV